MARNPRRDLPKRFRPYYDQALVQSELQYGSQGDLLAQLLQDTGRDYQRSVKQSRGGAELLRSGVNEARGGLDANLQAAGLNMQALAGTDDGRRISQTYANALNELDLRKAQAQEYGASGVRQAGEAYREDAGQIRNRLVRLVKDRGLYTNELLGGLIEGDRNARRTARADAREQQFTAEQKALDRDTRIRSSIIGQNVNPDTGKVLNPRKDRGSSTDSKKKPKLTTLQVNAGIDAITNARGAYQQFSGQQGFDPRGLRNGLRVGSLPGGADAKPIKIPKVSSDIYITAGFELAKGGRLSAKTAAELKRRGLRIPASWRPRSGKIKDRPGTAPGPSGQQRPT